MQRFIMFSEVPSSTKMMYPDGQIKTKAQVIEDYPVLGTSIGVIGITTDSKGTIGDLVMMGYYDNIHRFVDSYTSQGADVPESLTNAQKCAVITDFVNNPPSEEEDALDTYLAM